MTRAPYTVTEDATIVEMRSQGVSYLKIGRSLGRGEEAVKSRHRMLTNYYKAWQPPFPGCAALVRAQIATGQVQRQGLQDWVARHGGVM